MPSHFVHFVLHACHCLAYAPSTRRSSPHWRRCAVNEHSTLAIAVTKIGALYLSMISFYLCNAREQRSATATS